MTVEVCANSLQSAINAEEAGADRIELCSELGVGGITPSYALIKRVREALKIPIHVLIRPRSGDFTYSKSEFEIMLADIEQCIAMGCDGVVAGVLKNDLSIDKDRARALKIATGNLKFTFHRAIDWTKNPLKAACFLDGIGTDYILSSGQRDSAVEGLSMLANMQEQLKFSAVLPGGGVRAENAHLFKEKGFKSIHLSGVKFHKTMQAKPEVSMNSHSFLEEDQVAISDKELIQKVVEIVK